MKTKIFAMYLPQYHEIPENDEFWGKGFTDWNGVKNAKPLFKNHDQPRIPLNNNYYDLSKEENVLEQVKLAKEYGIDGFGIYHYWFNDEKNLLTKPSEILLSHKEADISFFFAWDNISWKRTWSKIKGNDWAPISEKDKDNKGPEILIEHKLGNEDSWIKHFNYLLPFFKDERYVKKDGMPVFLIYHVEDGIFSMMEYWNKLAKENGFNGIYYIFRHDILNDLPTSLPTFCYEPSCSGWSSLVQRVKRRLFKNGVKIYDYDKIWKKIITKAKEDKNPNLYYGAFVGYDDTPRRGEKGTIIKNSSPEKFARYLENLFDISNKKQKDFIFLTAWNEWGEGAYLEPDTNKKYSYLEAIKSIKSKK